MRLVLLLVGLSGACVSASEVQCSDGRTCPLDTLCDVEHHLCVTQGQLDECANQADLTDCALPADRGNCQQGVCLPIACGNERIDLGEMCDDGNFVAGDGCSADCVTTESCGNGYVDLGFGETCDDANQLQHDGCSSACQVEVADWAPLNTPPHGRFLAGGTYDAHVGRVIIFGGRTTDAQAPSLFLSDTLTWNGQWIKAPNALGPEPRSRHGIAYDAGMKRTIVFGGAGGLMQLRDTWAWDGTGWTRLADGPLRRDHAMAYDARRDKIVVFGGLNQNGLATDETWEFDGASWVQVTVAPRPSARSMAAMTYDPDRAKIVLFGGCDLATVCVATDDLWEYDGTSWSLRSATGAAPVSRAGLAYDRAGHQLVLFGGLDNSGAATNGTYTLGNGSTWTQVGSVPISKRSGAALVDDNRGGLLLFGGVEDDLTEPTDTWRWTGASWQQATLPTPRILATVAYSAEQRRVLLFGGRGGPGPGPLGDTWELSDSGWRSFAATGALQQSAMTYDAARGQFVRFGGSNGTNPSALTAVWSGSSWTALSPAMSPSARVSPVFVYDPRRAVSVLFGGAPGNEFSDETWSWDGTTWSKLEPATTPPKRLQSAATYDPVREVIVMFGGNGEMGFLNDTWLWDGVNWQEAPIPMGNRPSVRSDASLVWNPARQRVVLSGGTANRLDTWEWDGTTWTEIQTPTLAPFNQAGVLYPLLDGSGLGLVTGQGQLFRTDSWQFSFASDHADETCTPDQDLDGDGRTGCADPDCWTVCSPTCPPAATCPPNAPRCGDGTCQAIESCHMCAGDCPTCTPSCGDFVCDPGETCLGDC